MIRLKTILSEIKETNGEDFNGFVKYACERLKIEEVPHVKYLENPIMVDGEPSFACFEESTGHIIVCKDNRHWADVMRSIAHELVHLRQRELGKMTYSADDGATGSELENQANALAGIIMRDYGKKYPNIYKV